MYFVGGAVYTYFLINGFLNILSVFCGGEDMKVCRSHSFLIDEIEMKHSDKKPEEICGIPNQDVQIFRIPSDLKDPQQKHLVLGIPKEITRLIITFNGVVHAIGVNGSKARLLSCSAYHDTLLITSSGKNPSCVHVLLKLKYLTQNVGSVWINKTGKMEGKHIRLNNHENQQSKIRLKRSNPEKSTQMQYKSISAKMTDISECGKTRSCFRYHPMDSHCGHMKCSYFLSYSYKHIFDDMEYEYDFELSGRTSGWIAVGFSSDKQMMGDALACKTNNDQTDPIVQSYKIPMRQAHPKLREGFKSNLTIAVKQNNFMYCRFLFRGGQGDMMDLTNDWFQLYGRGPVSYDGDLLIHQETPLISNFKISLIKSVNKMNVYTSQGSSVTSGYLWFLWTSVSYMLINFLN
ncbi:uncharacterized protein LOC133193802 [Saccostrea echinata]|uniref:uncharacterized protein LOC133193802 n=1 Tax=Saccostrea echinata TaxID=191078 RepID=UPI002A80A3F1|nr:uncharacterized protein LOC133193802 [Saccostrea echinata]